MFPFSGEFHHPIDFHSYFSERLKPPTHDTLQKTPIDLTHFSPFTEPRHQRRDVGDEVPRRVPEMGVPVHQHRNAAVAGPPPRYPTIQVGLRDSCEEEAGIGEIY